MIKKLTILLVLLMVSTAWGQPDFIIGDSLAPGALSTLSATGNASAVYDSSIFHWTASAGDTVRTLYAYARSGKSGADTCIYFEIGLYVWNTSTDSATTRAFVDTFLTSNCQTSGGYDSITDVDFGLSAGVTYTIAISKISDSSAFLGHIVPAPSSGKTISRLEEPTDGLTDPFDWTPIPDVSDRHFYLWAYGTSDGGGGSAQATAGAATVGAATVGSQ